VDFVLPKHLRERNAELSRAHRARDCDHHFVATIKVVAISIGCVFDYSRIEVTVMPIDKFADRARFRAANVRGFSCPLSLHGKPIT
jgi:hypothetical protein